MPLFLRLSPSEIKPGALTPRSLAAIALACAVSGACVTEPETITNLAGSWVATDTFEFHYSADGTTLNRGFSYVNEYPVVISSVSDTMYAFQVRGGTQTQIETTVGGSGGRDVV